LQRRIVIEGIRDEVPDNHRVVDHQDANSLSGLQ
jgi:hypothetical protein